MHNKVVYHAMKSFQSFGIPVLRFNFRGAGLSEGTHDNGQGEVGDLRAALDWMQQEYQRPILFAGFSFGAFVGLKACCGDDRVKGIAALGLPVSAGGREYRYRFLANCAQPKLFISGSGRRIRPAGGSRSCGRPGDASSRTGDGTPGQSFLFRQAGVHAGSAQLLDRNPLLPGGLPLKR